MLFKPKSDKVSFFQLLLIFSKYYTKSVRKDFPPRKKDFYYVIGYKETGKKNEDN